MNKLFLIIVSVVVPLLVVLLAVSGCCGIQTPEDTKYLEEFHRINFEQVDKMLPEDRLALYVDYSTCCALGKDSQFFQDVSGSLVDRTTEYYSIKGDSIKREPLTNDSGVYERLRNIEEVNYADLKTAAKNAVEGGCEAVMLTDGEYFKPNIAKGHENDPYLADAFRSWILAGHDIHIISEPYVETNNGQSFNKKRFYIMFTDDRMSNNIYERVIRTVDLCKYPEVDEFHISASHPQMKGETNNTAWINPTLNPKAKGFGRFEIEDWDACDWGTIEDVIVNALDENTGEHLKDGEPIIKMAMDKNSFGCYRVKSVGIKVYDINSEYTVFYNSKEGGEQVGQQDYNLQEIENFMQIDANEFNKHSKIGIYFNKDWFNPNVLTGKTNNYFKIDIVINAVEPIFSQHAAKFRFESISIPDYENSSVASSIEQCLADQKVLDKMNGQVIYSIYVKSEGK